MKSFFNSVFKKGAVVLAAVLVAGVCFTGCGTNIAAVKQKLSNYNITASFDDSTKILTAGEELNYINSTDIVLNEVDFHLYPNAFSEGVVNKPVSILKQQDAYYNGMNYGGIDIKSVLVNDKEVPVNVGGIDNEILTVNLGEELYPDDRINIKINFEDLLPNVKHRYGYGEDSYNFGNFYPIACVYENGGFVCDPYNSNGDPFYSDMANYNVNLTFDSAFTPACTGDITSNAAQDGKTAITSVAGAVRDFAFILSKNYHVKTAQAGDTTVNYYYFNDPNSDAGLKAAVDSINTYNSLFGLYPYKTFNVAEADFIHGGMEYPNLVLISGDVTNPADYLNVIIHETAHQWWYNLVGNNEYKDPWLDEGLTDFSTLLFYENNPDYNINTKDRIKALLSSYGLFTDVYTQVYGTIDTSMNRSLNQYKSEMDYVYTAYVKGTLFFNDLRDMLGNKTFLRALQLYFKNNEYKNAHPEDLIYAFEHATGRALEGYINSWIEGKMVIESAA